MTADRVDFDSIPWTTPMPNVRFKVHRQGSRQLRIVEFGHGFVEPDWCMHGHIGLVLDGSGLLQYADREVTFKKGDGVFIPAGEEHKHKLTVLSEVFRVVLMEDV